MNNEIEFKFGDYAIIEQKRHGVPNEMFVHKVIGQLRSNTWVDVPVQSPATETLHDEMEDVCWCICCGVSETEVRAYRVKDMQRSNLSPDGGEVTALALTLEKSREESGCPAGVDLQDWVKQLAAENVALKSKGRELLGEACAVYSRLNKLIDPSLGDFVDGQTLHEFQFVLDVETPATDRIVAEAEARGVEKFAAKLRIPGDDQFFDAVAEGVAGAADAFAKQLREGADK
ncbi:TPA: hypothetical protein L7I91_005670 [Klebsiella aerogenes]|nr:hypothetical protein [Klebsiella aerogenes]HCB3011695.1 hypothetical protein [Klebsiella aerogenes]